MHNMFRFSLIYYLPSGVSSYHEKRVVPSINTYIYIRVFVNVCLYFYSICDLENNKW